MTKFMISILSFLLLAPYECSSGRVSYSLSRLDAQTDGDETPYNRGSTCGLVGTRLLVKYETTNLANQYEPLWAAEIKYVPERVLIRASAPKVKTESAAVTVNYFLYGANTLDGAQTLYRTYYNNPHYNFPFRDNGNFQYQCSLATPGFSRLAANTELFLWTRLDNPRAFTIQAIIDNIAALRNGNNFPPYCAKGFTVGPWAEDVLNCITFDMRLLNRFGIPVNSSNFINQYLNNTAGINSIAYPERFLEPLVRVCSTQGGLINRRNVSSYYNNEYYSNGTLRELLEPRQPADEVINQQFPDGSTITKRRYGQMWIIGEPSPDIRSSVNTSTLLGEGILGAGGATAGYFGATAAIAATAAATEAVAAGTTVVAATGGTAALITTATAINTGIASLATSAGLLAGGATLPAVVTIGAPVVVLGGAGIVIGYAGVKITKKIISWF